MKKNRFILVLIIFICSCTNNKNLVKDNHIYQENTRATTCTNDNSLTYDFQIASLKKLEDEKFNLFIKSDSVNILNYEFKYIATLTNNVRVYSVYLTLKVPTAESRYDVVMEFTDLNEKIELLGNTNMNYNHPNSKLKYRKSLTGWYDNRIKTQSFDNEIKLPEYDVHELKFSVLGETLINSKILDKNTVILKSEGTMPTIVGYSFEKGDEGMCIGNTYHVSDFNEANEKLMSYFGDR